MLQRTFLLIFGIVVILAGPLAPPAVWVCVHAQTSAECRLMEPASPTDIVGKTGPRHDGTPDKVFSLKLRASPKRTVTEIELRTVTGKPGHWKAPSDGRRVGYIGVAKAKVPSDLINRKKGPLNIGLSEAADLLLYVTDDGHFSDKDRTYRVDVKFQDGNVWSSPVETKSPEPLEDTKPAHRGSYPVRMSAVLRGLSKYDAVGPDKTIKGDDKPDGLLVLSIQAADRVINGIQIRREGGKETVWDTVPSTRNAPVGVASVAEPVRLLNHRDGTVSIPVKQKIDLNLYVADDGSIAEGRTTYRVMVSFEDGEIAWCPVQKAEPERKAEPEKKTAPTGTEGPEPQVNFLATWEGFQVTDPSSGRPLIPDAVGKYPSLKPDGQTDAVVGLDIEISPPSYLAGIEINSLGGQYASWGTGGTTPGNWGLAVTSQGEPSRLLNYADGAVRIPVSRRSRFYLYVADPGDIKTSYHRLRVIVHLADGMSFQQFLRGPHGTASPTKPPGDASSAAVGLMTCKFVGIIPDLDLVNASTRPGKDGVPDGALTLSLQVGRKTVAKVEILDGNGKVRWSSDGKGQAAFLGVAAYPKLYVLLNSGGGPLNVEASGQKNLQLYAADNGLLAKPEARLTARVHFTDGTSLSAAVMK
ncbi:MAG: hypothetical protein AB1646_26045 [Thermodesulfobacteriota bacterium]